MRRLFWVLATLAASSGACAIAAPATERDQCIYSSMAPNAEASVETCARLIASGSFTGDELAKLYVARLTTLHTMLKFDQSLAVAEEVLTKVLRHVPGAPVQSALVRGTYYWRGGSYFYKKDYAKAIADFTAVLQYRADDYNALYMRGRTYVAMGDGARAIPDLNEATRLYTSGEWQMALEERARAYELTNDLPKALADARTVLRVQLAKGYGGTAEREVVARIEQRITASGAKLPPEQATSAAAAPPPPPPKEPSADEKDRKLCIYSSDAPSRAASIAICDRLIASGRFSGDQLSELYAARMESFYSISKYDRAIADANHIITKILGHGKQARITSELGRDAYYKRGNAYYYTKKYALAVADLNAVIAYRPADYNALFARGQAYFALADLSRAIADFDETMRIDPKHVLGHRFRALAYEKKNDLPKALNDARRALDIEKAAGNAANPELEIIARFEKKIIASGGKVPAPDRSAAAPPPAREAAVAPSRAEEDETAACTNSSAWSSNAAAIENCTRLIASGRFKGEKLVRLYGMRIELFLKEKQFDRVIADANEILTNVLSYTPGTEITQIDVAGAHFVRGMAHLELKDYAKALSDLNAIFGYKGDLNVHTTAEVRRLRGRAHTGMNNTDAAIADFNEAIRLDATKPDAYRDRALAYEKKNDLPQALTDARRAVEIARPNGDASEAESEVARIEQKIAAGLVTTVAPSPPVSIAAATPAYAQACQRFGGNNEATAEACTRAIESGRFSGDELAKLYVARMRSLAFGLESDRAIADGNEVVARLLQQPRQGGVTGETARDVYFWRGRAYAYNADYTKALADFDLILRDHPWHSSTLHERGLAYLEMNDPDRAIADFSEAISRDAANQDAPLRQRILAYEKKNDLQRALADARLQLERAKAKGGASDAESRDLNRIEKKIAAGPSVAPHPNDTIGCHAPSKAMKVVADICTSLIESGRYEGDELIELYASRMAWRHRAGQTDRALADAAELLAKIKRPEGAEVTSNVLWYFHFARGEIYLDTKDYPKALADFNAIIRFRARDSSALQARGQTYLEMNDLPRALADTNDAIRLAPKSHTAYRSRALIYEQQQELTRALPDARRAAELAQADNEPSKKEREIVARIEQKIATAAATEPTPAPEPARAPAPSLSPAVAAVAPAPAPVVAPPVAAAPAPVAPPSAVVAVAPPPVVAATPPAPAPVVIPPGARVALVIGNGKYRHVGPLANPTNDAADISATLRRLGFDVIEGLDLDKRGMEEKVREFGRKLDRAELALFYYAGHGMQVAGKNYLLPVDGKLERPGDLNFDAMDISFIIAQMEADQRVNLIFLDACRDNPLAQKFARSLGTRSSAVGQGLASIQGALGTMIGYATQPDAVADDGDGARNSPFTAAMIRHLNTPGLEIGSLMRRVRADVVRATRGKQIPWDHSSLLVDVVLAR